MRNLIVQSIHHYDLPCAVADGASVASLVAGIAVAGAFVAASVAGAAVDGGSVWAEDETNKTRELFHLTS